MDHISSVNLSFNPQVDADPQHLPAEVAAGIGGAPGEGKAMTSVHGAGVSGARPARRPRRAGSGPQFPWFLSVMFVLCVAILGAEVYSFVSNIQSVRESTAATSQRNAVLRSVDGFKLHFLGAKAGYQGFLLSGKTDFLAPYHRFSKDYRSEIEQIGDLVSDDPMQQQRLDRLRVVVEGELKSMRAGIALREAQGLPGAATALPAERKQALDEVDALIDEIRGDEGKLLDLHARSADHSTVYWLAFALGSGVLGILGLTAFYALTRKYFFRQGSSAQSLRDREREFRAIFDVAAVGILECVADSGAIVRANSKLCAMLGYPASELEQMNFFQLLDPATAMNDREAFQRMLATHSAGPWTVERRCVRRDGSSLWVRASFDWLTEADGARGSAVGIFEDINDRKLIERELGENDAILRTVAEDTQDLISVKDVHGRLSLANPALLKFLGRRREDIIGHAEIDFLEDPRQAKQIRDLDRRVMQERTPLYVEEEMSVAGETRVFLSTKVPYTNDDGDVIGVIGISRDITERKELETELRHSRDQLASDVHERNQQLANLSRHLIHVSEEEKAKLSRELHDELGSALAAVSMDMGWVLRQIEPAQPEVARRLERAFEGIRATLELKRRLIDGLRPLTLEHFGFEFALRAHCEAFAASSKIAVEVRTPDLPLRLDAARGLALFRVVQECLTNVAKHAQASRVVVSVEVSEAQVDLSVEDDGTGLPAGVIQRPETYGLVGMRERVAALGGTLAIGQSRILRGAMVCATVPLPVDRDEVADDATLEMVPDA